MLAALQVGLTRVSLPRHASTSSATYCIPTACSLQAGVFADDSLALPYGEEGQEEVVYLPAPGSVAAAGAAGAAATLPGAQGLQSEVYEELAVFYPGRPS